MITASLVCLCLFLMFFVPFIILEHIKYKQLSGACGVIASMLMTLAFIFFMLDVIIVINR